MTPGDRRDGVVMGGCVRHGGRILGGFLQEKVYRANYTNKRDRLRIVPRGAAMMTFKQLEAIYWVARWRIRPGSCRVAYKSVGGFQTDPGTQSLFDASFSIARCVRRPDGQREEMFAAARDCSSSEMWPSNSSFDQK
jgi:hypothetical protein